MEFSCQFLVAVELCFRCSPRGCRGFLGSLVWGSLALFFCIVSLRLFSSANDILGAVVAFRGPFWDSVWIVFKAIFVYLLMLVRQRTRLRTGDLQAPAKTSTIRADTKRCLMKFAENVKSISQACLVCQKRQKYNKHEQQLENKKTLRPKSADPRAVCCVDHKKRETHISNTRRKTGA